MDEHQIERGKVYQEQAREVEYKEGDEITQKWLNVADRIVRESDS